MTETLGTRLGRLRAAHSLTQQHLADRIAVSRVAISHFEMDLAVPSERTVALLASVFKLEPLALVADTHYPPAKAERLPLVVARYTEVEKELCLLERDLEWLDRIHERRIAFDVCHDWLDRLSALEPSTAEQRERRLIETARVRLQAMLRMASHT